MFTVLTHRFLFRDKRTHTLLSERSFFLSLNPGTPECSADLCKWKLKVFFAPPPPSAPVESAHLLGVGVRPEHLVYPLREERHVDEDAGLVLPRAASAVDAHAHDDLDVAVLAHQGAAVVPLRGGGTAAGQNPCFW